MNDLRRVSTICVCAVCLIMIPSALAQVAGVVAVDETSPEAAKQGLRTCGVYAQFYSPDDPQNRVLSVYSSNIATDDPDGFYQHALGGDTAPGQVLLDLFPDLAHDSFVTIGVRVGDGTDGTVTDPDFDSKEFNFNGHVVGGWFNANPPSGQGDPDEEGNLLIAQFTVREGFTVSGTLFVFARPTPDPAKPEQQFQCFAPCPADLNGDGVVEASDLALLLGAWGPNSGDGADLNEDGVVDAADLQTLIAAWGPCE